MRHFGTCAGLMHLANSGAGRTIVIVDSFGSPTIANDLHVFDQQWGFPDPDLQVMKFGNVPPFNPNDSTMVGWAQETTLDVEYAHAIAPGAKIVLAETPVAEVEGTSGFPEMMAAEHLPRLRQRRLLQPAQPAVRVQGRARSQGHRARLLG
jgi:hypothetical protein